LGSIYKGRGSGIDPASSHRCTYIGCTTVPLLCHGTGRGGQWWRRLQGTASLLPHHEAGGIWSWH
jgi:hypothetical protein